MITLLMLGEAVLALKLIVSVCMAPCDITVTVTIENASERDVCYVTIEGNEYRSSQVTVESGRRTYQLPMFYIGTAGEYDVRADLYRPVNRHYMAHRPLLVR